VIVLVAFGVLGLVLAGIAIGVYLMIRGNP
jgi:hypothetical protein